MSESEKDAIIGKAVRENAEAKSKLALLVKEAENVGFTFERLSKALREDSPAKAANHIETLLSLLEKEKVDWSKLTSDSLKALASTLKKAISDVERTQRERQQLGI
ncbi:MAG: hypothetical protein ABSF14_15230 [Terriglobia bacterium]|jgi:uncharacterized NAD(P)/FAD-binding protein YdhS